MCGFFSSPSAPTDEQNSLDGSQAKLTPRSSHVRKHLSLWTTCSRRAMMVSSRRRTSSLTCTARVKAGKLPNDTHKTEQLSRKQSESMKSLRENHVFLFFFWMRWRNGFLVFLSGTFSNRSGSKKWQDGSPFSYSTQSRTRYPTW